MPAVTKLSYVKAPAGEVLVDNLYEGIKITPETGKTTILAQMDATTKSVKFDLTGALTKTQTETQFPLSLFGDGGATALNGQVFPEGAYSLKVTPYSGAGASGTPGTPVIINFSVAAVAPPPPPPPAKPQVTLGYDKTEVDVYVNGVLLP